MVTTVKKEKMLLKFVLIKLNQVNMEPLYKAILIIDVQQPQLIQTVVTLMI